MDTSLWRRTFTRGTQPDGSPVPDIDSVADEAFVKANFKDKFGIWLTQGNNKLIGSFDGLLSTFFNDSANFKVQTYVVADGTYIPKKNQGPWYNAHVRLLSVVTPPSQDTVSDFTGLPWLFFIVGSSDLTSEARFLQVASWDKTTFRFYQRDIVNKDTSGWIFQGESMDAFGDLDQYLGPFNGHVNGACIMKEIHQPWIHWLSPTNNLRDSFSQAEIKAFESAPYLTKPGNPTLLGGATVLTADDLEPLIISGLRAWFKQRQMSDFYETSTQLTNKPKNIQRWVSHLLLTTTVNIAGARDQGTMIPADHFFDNELLVLQQVFTLTDGIQIPDFVADDDMYQKASTEIGLCILQEIPVGNTVPPEAIQLPMQTLGGGKQTDESDVTSFVVAAEGEGVPFTILQSSIEDSYGAAAMQKMKAGKATVQLFSESTVNALCMVDFWNPIYSWRRGRLMQYIPTATTLNGTTYDLESTFISTVKASSASKDSTSPEYAFIQLLGDPVTTHQSRIKAYIDNISKRLKIYDGLLDYMKLAESRRRIYRPLPLNEFGATLPYARKLGPELPMYEMMEAGTIQPMPDEGVIFLRSWIGGLAGYDPHLLNENNMDRSVVHPSLLPRPANLPLLCQNLRSTNARAQVQSCPFMRRRNKSSAKSVFSVATLPQLDIRESSVAPTWNDDILALFQSPYWPQRPDTGSHWRESMLFYGYGPLDLWNPVHVQRDVVTIHGHLRSRLMPIVRSEDEFWPDDALELLRAWANGGFRISSSDPVKPQVVIPKPVDPPAVIRIRKDILSLTDTELQTYRAKLEDVLGCFALNSKWQELGLLHAQWCLHYQEGFVLWHRAMLTYVEELIDFPIPYWNGFAANTADPTSPYAGIPGIFLEDTYEHPTKGTRPNPLKYALTLDGFNKDTQSKYATRNQVLVHGPKSPDWIAQIAYFSKYHQQLVVALSQQSFSHPEEDAIPWANIPKFLEDMPDNDYMYRTTFDGLFEQAHDNYHGWVGGLTGDMADNTYTAFDPIFYSYHANIDRIAASFMRSHPEQQYSLNFPLQPFIDNAKNLNYTDPRVYLYTTIGDMAKDTMALGYLYAPPSSPDYQPLPKPQRHSLVPKGGNAAHIISKADIQTLKATQRTTITTTPNSKIREPWILFPNITCTTNSYTIDIFPATASSTIADHTTNPSYIGRLTRLGMGTGPEKGGLINKQRCHKPAISRAVPAAEHRVELERADWKVRCVVRRLKTGEEVGEEERKGVGGFEGRVVWKI